MAKNCLEGKRAALIYGMEEGWQRPLPEKGWLEGGGSVALFSTRRERQMMMMMMMMMMTQLEGSAVANSE